MLVFLLLINSSFATELYDWHTIDLQTNLNKKIDLTLHQRSRIRHEFTYLEQVRAGIILRYKLSKVNLVFGQYYQPAQLSKNNWTEGYRMFTGLDKTINSWTLRGSIERHINTGRTAYNRYRTYERYTFLKNKISPFFQNEVLLVTSGLHSTRNSVGISIRLNSKTIFDTSYLYDKRKVFWGGDRQAIVTSLRYKIN